MYTYRPIHITPSGLGQEEPNALGVFLDDRLVAVYARNPSSVERRKEVIFAFTVLILGFVFLLGLSLSTGAAYLVLVYVAGYLGFAYMIFTTLVYDPRDDEHDLDELTKQFALANPDIDMVQSYEGLAKYPTKERAL